MSDMVPNWKRLYLPIFQVHISKEHVCIFSSNNVFRVSDKAVPHNQLWLNFRGYYYFFMPDNTPVTKTEQCAAMSLKQPWNIRQGIARTKNWGYNHNKTKHKYPPVFYILCCRFLIPHGRIWFVPPTKLLYSTFQVLLVKWNQQNKLYVSVTFIWRISRRISSLSVYLGLNLLIWFNLNLSMDN